VVAGPHGQLDLPFSAVDAEQRNQENKAIKRRGVCQESGWTWPKGLPVEL